MSDIVMPAAQTLKFKGKVYQLQPAEAQDFEDVAAFMRAEYMIEEKKHMAGLPLELAKYAWDKATDFKNKSLRPGKIEFSEALKSIKALSYLCWLQVKKAHSDFTIEQATECINEQFLEATETTLKAAGISADSNPFPTPQETGAAK